MAESVSGQAHGGLKPLATDKPPPFRDPRTFVKHDFDERTAACEWIGKLKQHAKKGTQ